MSKVQATAGGACGLCGAATSLDETGAAYIMCQSCLNRMINISTAYQQQLDELPFGVIDLDARATVLAYNRAEAKLAHLKAETVIGKNFFIDVAPCAAVKEFQGRFREFMAGQEQMMSFRFTFSFKHGPVEVEIFLLRGGAVGAQSADGQAARIIVKRVGA